MAFLVVPVAPVAPVEPVGQTEPTPPRTRVLGLSVRFWLVAPLLFAAVFGARFLDFRLDNDHFRMITQGRQVLRFGELPYRDFLDPGIFLQIFTSAALQGLFGDNLLGQALFDLTIFGLAAVLTFHLATQAARSTRIGLLVTVLAVAMLPRLKQHQVILLPVLGLLLCWRYLDRPSRPRLIALGLAGGLAFLVRHDQGVYLAVPALITLVAAHWRDGWRVLLHRFALCAGVALLAVTPFFIFIQANGGLVEYFRSAYEYIQSEADRQDPIRLLAFKFDPAEPLFRVDPPPPRPPGHLQVRWRGRVTPEQQAQLEAKYKLSNPSLVERPGGDAFRYDVHDYSPENLRALVRDSNVDRTFLINRDTFRLDREPSEPVLISLWRMFPPFGWRFVPGLLMPANAVPWLFYVFFVLPILALLWLALRRPTLGGPSREAPKMLAAALLCLAMLPALRDPLASRLADVAAVPAILGSWLLARSLGIGMARSRAEQPAQRTPAGIAPGVALAASNADLQPVRRPLASWLPRVAGAVLAVLLVAVTALSVAKLPDFDKHFARLETSLAKRGSARDRVRQVMETLQNPAQDDALAIENDLHDLVRYAKSCTQPTDRLLVTWFAPEAYFYAQRGFTGRQIFWFTGFYAAPDDQERSLASLRAHSVPIAIHQTERQNSVVSFPAVQAYLTEHYRVVHRVRPNRDSPAEYQVLVDHRRTPTGTYDRLPLPCYA